MVAVRQSAVTPFVLSTRVPGLAPSLNILLDEKSRIPGRVRHVRGSECDRHLLLHACRDEIDKVGVEVVSAVSDAANEFGHLRGFLKWILGDVVRLLVFASEATQS